jgi:hypothetical protein
MIQIEAQKTRCSQEQAMQAIEPGQFYLSILHQDTEWIDVQGVVHQLDEMNADYLGNVLDYLHRNAARFRHLQDTSDMARDLLNVPHETGVPFDDSLWDSPQEWIETTALARAIRRKLETPTP